MRNRAMKRMIAILLCLVVFAGSELSGLTNIVGDLFAEETTADADIDTREKTVEPVDVEAQPEKEESTTGNMDGVISRTEDLQTSENSLPDSSAGVESTESSDTSGGTDDAEQPSGTEDAQNPEQDDPGSGVTEEPEEAGPADENKEDNTSEKPDGDPQAPAEPAPKEEEPAIPETPADEAPEEGIKTPQEETAQTPPEESEVPAEDAEEEEPEKEWEYDESMDLETFETLGDDEVGEIMLWDEAVTFSAPRRTRARTAPARTWSFDLHYVNQDDDREVTKDDSFSLKYQVEFRNNGAEIPENAVEIRIPRNLLKKRGGDAAGYITEDQVALPAKAADGEQQKYGSTAFLHRIEEDDLVFYNAKPVPAGTNSMWQVLYQVDSMDVLEDGESNSWSLTPSVSVGTGDDKDELSDEDCAARTLTGTVDPYVRIDSFAKSLYNETNRNYTPELYSESQVKTYIDGPLPGKFSGEDFNNYYYIVWEMTVQGTATQPWQLKVEELPVVGTDGTGGYVVGYKDRSNDAQGYNVPVTTPSWGENSGNLDTDGFLKAAQTLTGERRERSFGSRFLVVTAYPKTAGTTLRNQANVTMDPIDETAGSDTAASQLKERIYQEYVWEYDGDTVFINKNYTAREEDNVYSGWLDVYRRAGSKGQDYGEFPFTTGTSFYGYKWTHDAGEGGRLGERKQGNTFKLIATDDTMYAALQTDGTAAPADSQKTWLGPEDYYFTEITVTATDRDVDVFEDQEVAGESGTLKVYVMNGRDDDGKIITNEAGAQMTREDWKEIYTGTLDPKNGTTLRQTFRLTDAALTKEPWRVKAEYVSGNYVTTCKIDVKVRLRHDSPALAGVRAADSTISSVRLEDISGVLGQYLKNDEVVSTSYVSDAGGKKDDITPTPGDGTSAGTDPGSVKVDKDAVLLNYAGYGVSNGVSYAKLTQDLYGGLLCRDNDDKKLTNLTSKAQASKASVSTNDSDNDRVLVDYQLTAYNGWQVYGQDAIPWLTGEDQSHLNPGHKDVVFYDLLPYGMKYDASPAASPTAGRITDLDRNGNYRTRPDLWVGTQVRVTVNPEEIVTNYRGTGRTLVVFHISYEGEDPSVYTGGMWMEGWGVRFRAYYEKKDLKVAQAGTNICAFMAADGSALIGEEGQIFPDDGKSYPANFAPEDKALGKIRQDSKPNVRNVMYAGNQATGEFVEATERQFHKKVKADDDRYGAFKDSAKVVPGKGYTYEIAVAQNDQNDQTADQSGLTGIVVYDALEQGTDESLRGTFQNVVTGGLTRLGVAPKVYYSWKADAEPPRTPADLTKEGADWIAAEAWESTVASETWKAAHPDVTIRAVAVDLSKKTDGNDFVLQKGQNVTFQIAMILPADAEEGQVIKNQASYYARSENAEDGTSPTRSDSSVTTVTVARAHQVEVIKAFKAGRNIPASVQNASFRFRLYELQDGKDGKEKHYLANQAYTLMDMDDNVLEGNVPHATDADGGFTLHAGEKAVLWYADIYNTGEGVSDDDRLNIYAEEVEEVFWQSEEPKIVDNSNAENGSRKITIVNDYRPVLYVQKLLQGVLADDRHQKEADEQQFTFRIETSDDGGKTWTPLGEKDYYYVDRAGLNGGIPGPDTKHGKTLAACKSTTDSEGRFRIKKGDVAALCFDKVGVQYRVSEVTANTAVAGKPLAVLVGENGSQQTLDWICQTENAAITGTTAVTGTRAVITNAYRWKELYLKKEITHQEPADYKNTDFTFRITRKNEAGTFADLSSEEAERITWQLTDAPEGGTAQHLVSDGSFTAPCGGRTVRISGLEAGGVYQVEEILPENPDYQPDQNPVSVTMPTSGDRRNITVTNDWLWRPLYVTKTVAYNPEDPDEAEAVKTETFRMTASVSPGEGETLPDGKRLDQEGIAYDVMEQGRVVGNGQTGANGVFELKNGQTAVFKDAAKLGWTYSVTELHEEKKEEIFKQVYPPIPAGQETQPATGTFAGERGEANIINGSNDNLYITKNYVCDPDDTAAQQYIASGISLPQANDRPQDVVGGGSSDPSGEAEPKTLQKSKHAVKVSLTLNGTPLRACDVTVIGADGKVYANEQWTDPQAEGLPEEGVYLLEPGTTVIIPADILAEYRKPGEKLSYELTELEAYRHRLEVFRYEEMSEGDEGVPTPVSGLIEINQKLPEHDAGASGFVEENPVASITNEVTGHKIRSEAGKEMTWNSTEVSEGAKLVWRVEKKTGTAWLPAENISYAVFGCYVEDEAGHKTLIPEASAGASVSGSVRTTGSDGWIEMYKAEGLKPHVYFPDQEVWLNLNGAGAEGEYRLVEVMEASDSGWGMLVGYGTSRRIINTDMGTGMTSYTKNNILTQAAAVKNTEDSAAQSPAAGQAGKQTRGGNNPSQVGYGKNIDYNLAVGEKGGSTTFRPKLNTFYNSNVPKAVEIAKEMEVPCDRPFTMVLEQVLLLTDDAQRTYASALNSVTPDKVLMSEGRAGIRYTVYAIDDAGDPRTVIREARTGPGGTLTLYAGEYASFDLPEGTLWTLTEDQPATFEKPALRTEGPAANRISQVGNENLMFVYQTAAAQPAPEPELRVNVRNPIVYLDDIRGLPDLSTGEFCYDLALRERISIFFGPEEIDLRDVSIEGRYMDSSELKQLAESTGSSTQSMDYTVTYTVPESGTVLTADFTLTYHPPKPITITRNIVDAQSVYDEDGEQITWKPDVDGTLKIPEFVRESANGPLCRVTQLGTGDIADGETTSGQGKGVFSQREDLQRIEVPMGVTVISWYAFKDCGNLNSIKLPEEMTSIAGGAFYGCKVLNNINIPKGITAIEMSTFLGCSTLENVVIPDTVKNISNSAFSGCTSLKNVKMNMGLEIITGSAFYNCKGLTEIDIPGSIKQISGTVFTGCKNLKIIRIHVDEKTKVPSHRRAPAPWGATNATVQYSNGNGGWIDFYKPTN